MDLNELAERLAALEQGDAQREQAGFIDKYGAMFSGDEGIGMAILAEMNRRGIGAAAVGADKAVQEILDSIRQEAAMVLDKIKMDRDTVTGLMDQVQEVQNAVAAATGQAAPGDGIVDTPPMPTPVGDVPPSLPPMDASTLPPPEGSAPPSGGEEAPPPPPPEPMPGEPAPPPLPPEAIASDVRIKELRKKLSDARAKKIVQPTVAKAPAPKVWKPGGDMLKAIKGGI